MIMYVKCVQIQKGDPLSYKMSGTISCISEKTQPYIQILKH